MTARPSLEPPASDVAGWPTREAMIEALKPFADAAAFWEPIYPDSEIMMKPPAYIERGRALHGRKAAIPQVVNGDLRRARDLLAMIAAAPPHPASKEPG